MNLEQFAHHFLSLNFACITPVEFFDCGNVLSHVLYRDAPWQVEFFTLRAGKGFPRQHRHPHVDAYEVSLGNDPPFILNDILAKNIWPTSERPVYQVRAEDWHGVGDVLKPVCFLSIQQWREVKPTSVLKDWEGTPMSPVHKSLLRQPGSVWIKTIRHVHTTANH